VESIRLLIIEDDPDQRDLIRETLEEHFGAGTVTSVASRREAMAQDLAGFDLILSDYNLPDSTGMDLLDEVRARCDTPLIMVTGENVGDIAAEAIRKGAVDYVVKFGDYLFTIPLVIEKNLAVAKIKRENEQLRQELEETLLQLQFKNAQLEESLQRVEQMAATDPLTGLYNRRHFNKVIEQLFAEAQRYGKDLACVMIDLDGYKQLNDTFGHQVGDQILVTAGKVIRSNLRKMDVAARYGGDEFVLILPHANADEAVGVIDRIRQEFGATTAAVLHRDKGVSMSVGVAALASNRAANAEQLIAFADAALYRAKDSGRNRVNRAETEVAA
jgi:two-component system, cell cycle response regulator